MELDSNEVVKKIEEYREDYSCSQATLMGICEVAGMPTEELALLAKGFSGGIGGTFSEGTCGAVTGALMVLGIAFGYSDKNDLEHKNLSNRMASDFMDLFKNNFNSYLCKEIIKDRPTCGMYVKFSVEAVEEIINRG